MPELNTLSTITTEIASHLGKELDEPFKRLLAQSVDNWRSRLIRNSVQEKPNESKFFRQTIYVPLIDSPALPGCITGPELCPVKVSAKPVPKPLRYGPSLYEYVGSVDGLRPFAEETPGATAYQSAGRYSSKWVFYGWVNDYIRISGYPNLTIVRMDGIFDKPYQVMQFNCDAGMDCDFWDKPYPCTGDIIQMIVQAIVESYKTAPADKSIEVSPQLQPHEPDGK